MSDIMFNEVGVDKTGTYKYGDWKKIAVHDEKNIKGFFGEYRFLSNFYPGPVYYEGLLYPCSENAYQAAKVIPSDRSKFLTIDPVLSKKMWKGCFKIDKNAEEWDARKYDVMASIVFEKFCRNIDLCAKLLETGYKYLEETNWWSDLYYGVDWETGKGQNILGHILMNIRSFWRNSDELMARLSVNGVYDQNIPNYK